MAKVTLSNIGSFTQAAVTTINQNNDAIEAALENTISRDGTTPNQMGADLDMNHNDVINVDNIDGSTARFDSLYLGDTLVIPSEFSEAPSAEHISYDNAISGAAADNVQDALDEFALSRVPAVATRAALKTLPTAIGSAYLTEAGREGPFIWKAPTTALQNQMVVKSVTVSSVDTGTDTFRMNEVVTSSFDATTNTFTAPGHGFTSGQQVIIPTTRNAFQGAGLYYIGSDVTANTFRLYTSPGTAALAGTSGLCQIGVKSTSVISNTIAKIGHRWADGTLVRVAQAVNGLSTTTDYYIKTSNVNNFTLSLTPGGSDVVLTGTDQVITYQPGDMTIREPHNMFTGQALVLDSDSAGDPLYFIATDQCYGQLAASFTDAMEGNAIDLTDATAFTFHHLADPMEARWVIKDGASRTGSAGAWQRRTSKVEGRHFGIVADGSTGTDNSEAVQSAIWLAYYLGKKKVYFDAYEDEIALKYKVGHFTHMNLVAIGSATVDPKNGITIEGDSIEGTRFVTHADSENEDGQFILDGNFWGVAHVVGSNPMNQGYSELRNLSIRGPGQNTGGTLSGLKTRGIWGLGLNNVRIAEFPRDNWECFSSAPQGTSVAGDDVDSTSFVVSDNLILRNAGRHGKSAIPARVGVSTFKNLKSTNNTNCGIFGCWINTTYISHHISGNGNRSITTSGGARFQASGSGAISRDVTMIGGSFENNFNYELNIIDTLGFRWIGGALNLYAPADAATNGLATDQAGIRIGLGNENWEFSGQKITNNTTAYGDIWVFDIATTSPRGRIRLPHFAGSTSLVRLQSGVDVKIDGANKAVTVTTTGATPVDCFVNDKALGTLSGLVDVNPVLEGITTAGAKSGGVASGKCIEDGLFLEFDVEYSQTSHTGTGGARFVLSGLPRNFTASSPVEIYWGGLTYTSPVQALAVGGSKTILLRQAATGSTYTNVDVPAGAAAIRLKGRVR